jgi:hypothetical protein
MVPRTFFAWRAVQRLAVALLVVGGIGAALGHRWGAYVLVAYVVVEVFGLLTVARVEYRKVMTRPWPKVAPLGDDDWDD